MAGKKGMTADISIDVQGAKSAIKDLETRLKASGIEIRKFNKLLKELPSKDLLLMANRQEVVKNQLTDLKKKMEALNKVAREYENSSSNPEKIKEYRKIRMEISKTKIDIDNLKNIEKEYHEVTTRGYKQVQNDINAVNGKLKATYTEMDNINKVYDKSNYKQKLILLKHEQNNLKQAISQTKEKIELLHEAKSKFAKESIVGDNITELSRLDREIVNSTKKLKELNKQYAKVGSGGARNSKILAEKMQNVGTKLQSVSGRTRNMSLATTVGLGFGIKKALDFETAMVGVAKTTDLSGDKLEELKNEAINMSKTLPSTSTEIAKVMETAGQLGIKGVDGIRDFTKTIIDLENSTNITADEASVQLAQVGNILGLTRNDYRKFGSTLVELGNNAETTEKTIMEFVARTSAAGKSINLTSPEILGLSTALASTGISAEAGGSAISKVMLKIESAVSKGGKSLDELSKIAGMSSEEFKTKFKENAMEGLMSVIDGMSKMKEEGLATTQIMDDMDLADIRVIDTMGRLVNTKDKLKQHVERANKAWRDNNALTNESNKFYSTRANKIKMVQNTFTEASRKMGDKFLESSEGIVKMIGKFADVLSKMDNGTIATITGITVAFAGFSVVTNVLGSTINNISTIIKVAPIVVKKLKEINVAQKLLTMGNPVGLAIAGVTALAGITYGVLKKQEEERKKAEEENQKAIEEAKKSHEDFQQYQEEMAKKYGQSQKEFFDSTLENNQQLKTVREEEKKVEEELYNIINELSQKKTGLTQKEIDKINELENKKDEILKKEIAVKENELKTLQVIGEEKLKMEGKTSDELIGIQKTTTDQIGKTYDELMLKTEKNWNLEIANLKIKHEKQGTIGSKAYQDELEALNKHNTDKIKELETNKEKEIREWELTSTGIILERTGALDKVKEINAQMYENETRHQDIMDNTEKKGAYLHKLNNGDVLREDVYYKYRKETLQEELEKAMDQHNIEMGGKLATLAGVTKEKGGKITKENESLAKHVEYAYNNLPEKTQKKFEEVYDGMDKAHKIKKDGILNNFSSLAKNIISNFKWDFGINSPSKVMMKIFGPRSNRWSNKGSETI